MTERQEEDIYFGDIWIITSLACKAWNNVKAEKNDV